MLPGVALSSQTDGVAVPDLVLYPFSGSAFLSGPLIDSFVDEQSMRLVTRELHVHLRHNTFSPALANYSEPRRGAICEEILAGIVSRLAGPGWNAQVAGLDAAALITRIGPQELRLRLPPLPAYSIVEPETVDVTLPGEALVARQPLPAGSFVVLADPGSCDLSGSLVTTSSEEVLQTRTTELVLTLRDDTWLRAIVDDPEVATLLLLGIRGQGGGTPTGWDTRVRPILTPSMLRLQSDTVLVLTVPASDAVYVASGLQYKIRMPETVTVAIPAGALRTRRAITAAPAVRVQASGGKLLMVGIGPTEPVGGSTCSNAYRSVAEDGQVSMQQSTIKQFDATLCLYLEGDTWDDYDDFNRTYLVGQAKGYEWLDLLANIYTNQHSYLSGWKQLIITRLRERVTETVERYSDTELRLKLPRTTAFDITMPETITISLPASATRARRAYVAAASFVVRPGQGEIYQPESSAIVDEEMLRTQTALKKVTFQLKPNTGRFWSDDIDNLGSSARVKLLQELRPVGSEGGALGWSAMVAPYLYPSANWQLESDEYDSLKDDVRSSLSLRLFQYENYNITTPETISLRVLGPPVLKSAALAVSSYFVIKATRGQAWFSGAMNEADVRAGLPHVLEVRLSDADWPAELLTSTMVQGVLVRDSGGAQQLLENLEAPRTELAGFHYVLKPMLTAGRLQTIGSSLLRITVPGSAAYSIASPETLRLSIPGDALSTRLDQPVEGYVVINATGGTVTVGGKLTTRSTEASMRDVASPQELELTLSDDEWMSATLLDAATGSLAPEASVDIFSDGGADALGWNNVVRPRLQEVGARLLNSSTLRLSFPPFPSYDISAPETLTLSIPATAVMSQQPITLSRALIIRAKSGSARLGGTLVLAALRGPIVNVSESYQLQLDILQDTSGRPLESLSRWSASLGTPGEASDGLLGALRSLPAGIALSNATIMPVVLNYTHVEHVSNFTLRLNVSVPSDLYTPEVNQTLASLPPVVFADNVTHPVQFSVTWFTHMEEVPTGVFERYNNEAALTSAAPPHLASSLWHPNLVAQLGSPAYPDALQHTLEAQASHSGQAGRRAPAPAASGAASKALRRL